MMEAIRAAPAFEPAATGSGATPALTRGSLSPAQTPDKASPKAGVAPAGTALVRKRGIALLQPSHPEMLETLEEVSRKLGQLQDARHGSPLLSRFATTTEWQAGAAPQAGPRLTRPGRQFVPLSTGRGLLTPPDTATHCRAEPVSINRSPSPLAVHLAHTQQKKQVDRWRTAPPGAHQEAACTPVPAGRPVSPQEVDRVEQAYQRWQKRQRLFEGLPMDSDAPDNSAPSSALTPASTAPQ